MLNTEAYKRRIQAARTAAQQAGFCTSITMGNAIDYFLDQDGIDPDHFSSPRGLFHEAMHAYTDCFDGSAHSEFITSIYERVFLRGSWNSQNPNDEADFSEPLPVYHYRYAEISSNFRASLIAAFVGDTTYTKPDISGSKQIYDRAVEDELFFRRVTDGRALYQLTTSELTELPLALFGLFKNDKKGFSTGPISQAKRREVLVNIEQLLKPSVEHDTQPS